MFAGDILGECGKNVFFFPYNIMSYVPLDINSSYRMPLNANGSDPLQWPQGTLLEYTARTTTTIGGNVPTAQLVKYTGASVQPGAIAGSAYNTLAGSEVGAGQNLRIEAMVGADDKYWVAYLHHGLSVNIGGITIVNPNTSVDNESSPTAYASQIILVRYKSNHQIDYVFSRTSGGVHYGISGLNSGSVTGRRDLQSELSLCYRGGELFLVGKFKGYLIFGEGISLSSGVRSFGLSDEQVFASRFSETSGGLVPRWATVVSNIVTATNPVAGSTAVRHLQYKGEYGCAVDTSNNLYFPIRIGIATSAGGVVTLQGNYWSGSAVVTNVTSALSTTLYFDTNGAGAASFTENVSITQASNTAVSTGEFAVDDPGARLTYAAFSHYVVKLGTNGACDTTFSAATNAMPAATFVPADKANINSEENPLGLVGCEHDSYFAVAYAVRAINYIPDPVTYAINIYFRRGTDGVLGGSNTFASGSGGVRALTATGTSAALCYDKENEWLSVAATSISGNNFFFTNFSCADTGTITNENVAGTESLLSTNTTEAELVIKSLATNEREGRPTVSIGFDYINSAALSTVKVGDSSGAADGNNMLASGVVLPTTGGVAIRNSAVLSVNITDGAFSFVPVSLIRYGQSGTTGKNELRGMAQIGDSIVGVGLGYFGKVRWTGANSEAVEVSAVNSGTNINLEQGSTNLVTSVTVGTVEARDRLLLMLEKAVADSVSAPTKWDAFAVPLLPGAVFEFSTARLIPGQNYYASSQSGEIVLTRENNWFLGVALTPTRLLVAGGPMDD